MNKEAAVLIPRNLLEGTIAVLERIEIETKRMGQSSVIPWHFGTSEIAKKIVDAIDAAPDAVIPIDHKPRECDACLYREFRFSVCPDNCPIICKEVKE